MSLINFGVCFVAALSSTTVSAQVICTLPVKNGFPDRYLLLFPRSAPSNPGDPNLVEKPEDQYDPYTRLLKDAFVRTNSGLMEQETERWAAYLLTPNGNSTDLKKFRLVGKISNYQGQIPIYRSWALGPLPQGKTWELVIQNHKFQETDAPFLSIPASDEPDRPLADQVHIPSAKPNQQPLGECRTLTLVELAELKKLESKPGKEFSSAFLKLGKSFQLNLSRSRPSKSDPSATPKIDSEEP